MFCQNKSIVRKEYVAPQFRPLNLLDSEVLCTSGGFGINQFSDDEDDDELYF